MFHDDSERDLMNAHMPHRMVVGESRLVLTDETTAAKNVQIVAFAVRDACRHDNELFKLKHRNNGLHTIESTREGAKILRAVTQQLPAIEELIPDNVFIPFVEQLRKQLNLNPELREIPANLRGVIGHEAVMVHQWLTELVQTLRSNIRCENFQRELHNRSKQTQKNHREGIRYIDRIFKKCSKVVVIRLDLVTGGESPENRGITQTVDLKQARAEFAKFLRHLRETFPLLGYLRELEYGLHTGYHFHMLIFVNGRLKRDGVRIAQSLGEHWKNVITEGRGRYWNCNDRPKDYERFALGMTLRKDLLKRKVLIDKVLDYLTRKRFWMRLEGVKKTFGKGQLESSRRAPA
ncbi:hypothetical protein SRS16CHR_04800 [Variovorax sp. SRS16]|uniref:inovirus-type Gp2 protein n=1 Tax=Variovorax sp. SRS16 TaxID=282217 RepID=UPI001318A931|nr:inovirus-type Gp2 protein [Variovorax sp. SRS16]VTU31047.1 hypothetical protein SRS16CHR_04800 [Variovorax sp. SRS16]